MNAADRLRQAIEALPELQRRPWRLEGGDMVVGDGVIMAEEDYVPRGIAAYIALMSPTVGAALADLLDAITYWDAKPAADLDASTRVSLAFDALEQAIERSSDNG